MSDCNPLSMVVLVAYRWSISAGSLFVISCCINCLTSNDSIHKSFCCNVPHFWSSHMPAAGEWKLGVSHMQYSYSSTVQCAQLPSSFVACVLNRMLWHSFTVAAFTETSQPGAIQLRCFKSDVARWGPLHSSKVNSMTGWISHNSNNSNNNNHNLICKVPVCWGT